jgi:DNA-3-methyladenine glycosylase II
MKSLDSTLILKAQKHLSRTDPVLKGLIKRFPPFSHRADSLTSPFEALVRAVASQQLHGAAAEAILRRFIALVPGTRFPGPDDMDALTDDQLRSAGFSRGKMASLRGLAENVKNGVVPSPEEINALEDDEIVSRITHVRGIGRWTVEMLLIFHLGRPDVLPVDDFGVRKGFMRAYGLTEMPKPKVLLEHGEKWRPYRTIASWYLWRTANE